MRRLQFKQQWMANITGSGALFGSSIVPTTQPTVVPSTTFTPNLGGASFIQPAVTTQSFVQRPTSPMGMSPDALSAIISMAVNSVLGGAGAGGGIGTGLVESGQIGVPQQGNPGSNIGVSKNWFLQYLVSTDNNGNIELSDANGENGEERVGGGEGVSGLNELLWGVAGYSFEYANGIFMALGGLDDDGSEMLTVAAAYGLDADDLNDIMQNEREGEVDDDLLSDNPEDGRAKDGYIELMNDIMMGVDIAAKVQSRGFALSERAQNMLSADAVRGAGDFAASLTLMKAGDFNGNQDDRNDEGILADQAQSVQDLVRAGGERVGYGNIDDVIDGQLNGGVISVAGYFAAMAEGEEHVWNVDENHNGNGQDVFDAIQADPSILADMKMVANGVSNGRHAITQLQARGVTDVDFDDFGDIDTLVEMPDFNTADPSVLAAFGLGADGNPLAPGVGGAGIGPSIAGPTQQVAPAIDMSTIFNIVDLILSQANQGASTSTLNSSALAQMDGQSAFTQVMQDTLLRDMQLQGQGNALLNPANSAGFSTVGANGVDPLLLNSQLAASRFGAINAPANMSAADSAASFFNQVTGGGLVA